MRCCHYGQAPYLPLTLSLGVGASDITPPSGHGPGGMTADKITLVRENTNYLKDSHLTGIPSYTRAVLIDLTIFLQSWCRVDQFPFSFGFPQGQPGGRCDEAWLASPQFPLVEAFGSCSTLYFFYMDRIFATLANESLALIIPTQLILFCRHVPGLIFSQRCC
ncbi:uncharacterized protein LY79DRAFT_566771 [Colletotrichum navitas]|uniref:Uncharacterized protein n=1 Tax=Colletotrichum navitas TaxID=681940 RepID=A0AAD8PPN2_9PEZI|nr:uncharacterized protein LY79DRAFT_566771 [Colletotrichum navitas]KAK1574104.1 hypothetical protein LY79DRAFT_566771 [Colletotrichum navitas]